MLTIYLSGSKATTWTLFEYSSINEPFRLFQRFRGVNLSHNVLARLPLSLL